ncbi:hypothetical protein BCR33DRAFT_739837 [Rhizoclosmatium globosum]|uniref:Uncharacterized protein n=1 Tax=Rhizoclosmatium globosum TaxID=329046 RepID=A0A1Y2C2U0_9FUNG|nr:hypothetical protein BCR33DRAFT_739837 [Rhizoclosmatium globosum]|eukprot:ORY41350.1 hypothetical protein BCR33DRAFT_739837 [Rhizoclosmatium globosum]
MASSRPSPLSAPNIQENSTLRSANFPVEAPKTPFPPTSYITVRETYFDEVAFPDFTSFHEKYILSMEKEYVQLRTLLASKTAPMLLNASWFSSSSENSSRSKLKVQQLRTNSPSPNYLQYICFWLETAKPCISNPMICLIAHHRLSRQY